MNKIRELRKDKNITMQKLSDDTGIGKSTIASYETRGINPKMENAKILADYFGVLPEYVLGLTDIKNHDQIAAEYSKAVKEHKDFTTPGYLTSAIDEMPREYHEINNIYRTLNDENREKVTTYAHDLQRLQEYDNNRVDPR